jgi:hypothetical protein
VAVGEKTEGFVPAELAPGGSLPLSLLFDHGYSITVIRFTLNALSKAVAGSERRQKKTEERRE